MDSCNSCLSNKSHRLPFSTSSLSSKEPLELICLDVWGPTPINSIDNYRFYVIFLDHYTGYTSLYSIQKKKIDMATLFPKFKVVVENPFKRSTVNLYIDGGREYLKLKSV